MLDWFAAIGWFWLILVLWEIATAADVVMTNAFLARGIAESNKRMARWQRRFGPWWGPLKGLAAQVVVLYMLATWWWSVPLWGAGAGVLALAFYLPCVIYQNWQKLRDA